METGLRKSRDRWTGSTMEIDAARARRRHNDERCAELLARSASAEAELAQARIRLTSLETERDSNRQVLESAAADLAAADSNTCRLESRSVSSDVRSEEHTSELQSPDHLIRRLHLHKHTML